MSIENRRQLENTRAKVQMMEELYERKRREPFEDFPEAEIAVGHDPDPRFLSRCTLCENLSRLPSKGSF